MKEVDVYDLLEKACRSIRVSATDVCEVERFADSVLSLVYGAGEVELPYDCVGLKTAALRLKYDCQQVRRGESSDILAGATKLIDELRAFGAAIAPEFSIYIDIRVRAGTY